MKALSLVLNILFISFGILTNSPIMSAPINKQAILEIPYGAPTKRIAYDTDSLTFGELRVPTGAGPHPVLVIIHGGCWTSKVANFNFMSPFAQAFTQAGIATWNIEYRCIDNKGGGWPGTFKDIGNAIDYLKIIAPQYNLNLNNVIVIGHSSGGHLALWSAARGQFNKKSELYFKNPLPVKAVVNLAGPGDLRFFLNAQQECCNDKVIDKLLDKPSGKMEARLKQSSPYELLPLSTKQILMVGDKEPAACIDSMKSYLAKAHKQGDNAELFIIKDAAHFEVVDPRTPAWQDIKDIIIKQFKS